MFDEILEKFGLKYEDLNPSEKETFNTWLDTLSKSQITLENVKNYVSSLKDSVSDEISKEPTFIRLFFFFKVENPALIRLQARLRNYLLLEAFLTTPEKAQKAIEAQINQVTKKFDIK